MESDSANYNAVIFTSSHFESEMGVVYFVRLPRFQDFTNPLTKEKAFTPKFSTRNKLNTKLQVASFWVFGNGLFQQLLEYVKWW